MTVTREGTVMVLDQSVEFTVTEPCGALRMQTPLVAPAALDSVGFQRSGRHGRAVCYGEQRRGGADF